jgi:hypothetical protein
MRKKDFHNKRKRDSNSLKRKVGNRKPYSIVLLVCEGEATEPNYFKGFCCDLKLDTNVRIMPCPSGTDPVNIVDFALEEFKKDKEWDRIYCIFDKEYNNYNAALNRITANFSNGVPIHAITSVPCFEYWLLLHFENSDRPYTQKGKKSPGDQLTSEIKKYLKNYKKGDKTIYEKTKNYIDIAIMRAKKIDNFQIKNDTDNPSTKVYLLAEYLKDIKK